VRKSRWHPFLRKDLIAALGPARPAVQSDIFVDFLERLETIEAEVQSWRTTPRQVVRRRLVRFMALRRDSVPASGASRTQAAGSWASGGRTKVYGGSDLPPARHARRQKSTSPTPPARPSFAVCGRAGSSPSPEPVRRPGRFGPIASRRWLTWRIYRWCGRCAGFDGTLKVVRHGGAVMALAASRTNRPRPSGVRCSCRSQRREAHTDERPVRVPGPHVNRALSQDGTATPRLAPRNGAARGSSGGARVAS
jgi:hypothetical protein